MTDFKTLLSGGDNRSIGNSNIAVQKVIDQKDFDELFRCIYDDDPVVRFRSMDAIEKITINNPGYLSRHKKDIIQLFHNAKDKEIKWHLALLIARLKPEGKEFKDVLKTLVAWVRDKSNSRIVRVNSLQSIYELTKQRKGLDKLFEKITDELKTENIPSINARIRILKKQ